MSIGAISSALNISFGGCFAGSENQMVEAFLKAAKFSACTDPANQIIREIETHELCPAGTPRRAFV
jgi:hypothetical protein